MVGIVVPVEGGRLPGPGGGQPVAGAVVTVSVGSGAGGGRGEPVRRVIAVGGDCTGLVGHRVSQGDVRTGLLPVGTRP